MKIIDIENSIMRRVGASMKSSSTGDGTEKPESPQPKFGGHDGEHHVDILIIEKAENGIIVRAISAATECEETFVFNDRTECLQAIAKLL